MGKTRKMYDWLYGDLNAFSQLDLVAIATIGTHRIGEDAAEWLCALSADPVLKAEFGDLPFELHRLYARH